VCRIIDPGHTCDDYLVLLAKSGMTCNSCSENPRFIFMAHICQVSNCEPIIIDLNTLWVLHPLTFKYRDLYGHSIIQFSCFFNVAIISIFLPHAIFYIYSHTTILTQTPTTLCLDIECASIHTRTPPTSTSPKP
jgi:hypothetical protein